MYDLISVILQSLATLIAFIALLITIFSKSNFLKRLLHLTAFSKFANEKQIFKRRNFIIYSSVVFASIITWGISYSSFASSKVKSIINQLISDASQLVINKKSGVIHHKMFCRNHLPISKNIINDLSLAHGIRFHQSKKVSILSSLSEQVSAEDAIEIILLAVENNPTSVHLYDKLIKLLGKLKDMNQFICFLIVLSVNYTKI